MKRIVIICIVIILLRTIYMYSSTVEIYSIEESEEQGLEDDSTQISNMPISYDDNTQTSNTLIPYNVPLEEIAEKIEYLYTYEKMLCDVSASSQYEELEPLPEGRMRMALYTAEGNKVLFLPEGIGNTEVLVNSELCELYYSEEREGYLFYYINDFRTNEGGVPVNAVGNGDWEEWFGVCIMDGESQPISDSRYYTYYPRFDSANLNKLGEIEVNLDAQKQISLSEINVQENEYIESMIRTVQSTLAEKEKYGEYEMYLGTYGRMVYDYDENSTVFKASGCVVGKDLEQYFFFTIYDASPGGAIISTATPYYPPSEQEWESGKYYFTDGEWLPCANQEERIWKIKEMERVKIPFTVIEGEDYGDGVENKVFDEKEHDEAEKIDFSAMSAEEAINMISYLYSYSEWFGMNELGCAAGEVRGFKDKELIMYADSNNGERLYFIPADRVNKVFICKDGREYPMYINEDGYAELYSISGNPAAVKTEHLKTTLWSIETRSEKSIVKSLENYHLIGRETLEIKELPLLEVPKIELDEYVWALEDYIKDLLVQAEKYGEYKVYIGEYGAIDANRVCISAAVCGEEEYYVRYLIIKSQQGKYYFWQAGFGLNGNLEECAADRHYMNKVCIDRTKQLGRMNIALYTGTYSSGWTIPEKEVDKETLKEQAVLAYQQFIDGRRSIGGSNIYSLAMPTGEPDSRYPTRYAIIDSNGDDIPELNIKSAREFTVISFEDGELAWFKCMEPGCVGSIYLLKNGAYMYYSDRFSTCYYEYFELDESGNEINVLSFYWDENNGNYIPDEEDDFSFDGNECTMEEWFDKTREYLYTDENGREQIRNQLEWTLYCEADPFETNDQVLYDYRGKYGYQLTLYDKEHREVLSEVYPKGMWIDGVSDDALEIGISVGNPANYTYYFNKETAEISDTFYNAILVGDKYIAYMEDGDANKEERTLILSDIFKGGILYQEITRDFSKTAEPMSAIISIKMVDSESIRLEYYKGETFTIESEIIDISASLLKLEEMQIHFSENLEDEG